MKSFIEKIFGSSLVLVDEQERNDKVGNGFTLVYRKGAGRRRSADEALEQAVVVVPVYKEALTTEERLSFKQCPRVVAGHPIS
ncbi:MAG: hypothetical protein M3461_23380 [Pseudomonadota bacterium]|nr:hypothetical protein [Pseudomonadota bacterium]